MEVRDYLGQELKVGDMVVYVFEQALPILFRRGCIKEILNDDKGIVLDTNMIIKDSTKHVIKIGELAEHDKNTDE